MIDSKKNLVYSYIHEIEKEAKKENKNFDIDFALNVAVENVLNDCSLIKCFPNLNLITNISGQMYERISCKANLAFITPENEKELNFHISYANRIVLNKNNVRTIRKLLESVDEKHCLVFSGDDKQMEAIGTAKIAIVEKMFAPIFKICGHMEWKCYLGKLDIMEYKDGEYQAITPKINRDEYETSMTKIFKDSIDEKTKNKIYELVEIAADLGHGTSIVIVDKSNYQKELERLSKAGTGHGIKLKETIDFFICTNDKIRNYLSQITKIDGGLIISTDGKCDAIGCIFDGEVFEGFVGNSGRGSRYNSIKLYVDSNNEKENGIKCMGIVISDDKTVNFIPEKNKEN